MTATEGRSSPELLSLVRHERLLGMARLLGGRSGLSSPSSVALWSSETATASGPRLPGSPSAQSARTLRASVTRSSPRRVSASRRAHPAGPGDRRSATGSPPRHPSWQRRDWAGAGSRPSESSRTTSSARAAMDALAATHRRRSLGGHTTRLPGRPGLDGLLDLEAIEVNGSHGRSRALPVRALSSCCHALAMPGILGRAPPMRKGRSRLRTTRP